MDSDMPGVLSTLDLIPARLFFFNLFFNNYFFASPDLIADDGVSSASEVLNYVDCRETTKTDISTTVALSNLISPETTLQDPLDANWHPGAPRRTAEQARQPFLAHFASLVKPTRKWSQDGEQAMPDLVSEPSSSNDADADVDDVDDIDGHDDDDEDEGEGDDDGEDGDGEGFGGQGFFGGGPPGLFAFGAAGGAPGHLDVLRAALLGAEGGLGGGRRDYAAAAAAGIVAGPTDPSALRYDGPRVHAASRHAEARRQAAQALHGEGAAAAEEEVCAAAWAGRGLLGASLAAGGALGPAAAERLPGGAAAAERAQRCLRAPGVAERLAARMGLQEPGAAAVLASVLAAMADHLQPPPCVGI